MTADNSSSAYRCIYYVRVSTEEQSRGDSCEHQEFYCQKLLDQHKNDGWVHLETISDPGYSARKLTRPGLTRLLDLVKAGRVDAVLVKAIDRISRDLDHHIQLEAVFARYGVALQSHDEPSRGRRAIDKLSRRMTQVVSQFEVEKTVERVEDTVRARAEKGYWGGGRPAIGYVRKPGDSATIYPLEPYATIVKRIFHEAAEGRPLLKIAEGLTRDGLRPPPSRAILKVVGERPEIERKFTAYGLRLIISNSVYRGAVRARNPALREAEIIDGLPETVEYRGLHERLVSDEIWHTANNAIIEKRVTGSVLTERDKHGYLLKNLLVCGHCRYAMSTTYGSKRRENGELFRYYRCVRSNKQSAAACEICTIQADAIERAVLTFMSSLMSEPKLVEQTLAMFVTTHSEAVIQARERLGVVDSELTAVHARKKEVVERAMTFQGDLRDTLQEEAHELARKRNSLEEERTKLAHQIHNFEAAHPDAKNVRNALEHFQSLMNVLPIAQQKEILRAVCQRIEISLPTSAKYLKLVQAGTNPRMYRVQLFLSTEQMQYLRGPVADSDKHRPTANVSFGFTIRIPLTRGRIVFEFIDGDSTVAHQISSSPETEPEENIDALNVMKRAIEWSKMRGPGSRITATALAQELAISKATLSLHLKLAHKIHPTICAVLCAARQKHILQTFSLRCLLRLSELSGEEQKSQFRELFKTAEEDKRRAMPARKST